MFSVFVLKSCCAESVTVTVRSDKSYVTAQALVGASSQDYTQVQNRFPLVEAAADSCGIEILRLTGTLPVDTPFDCGSGPQPVNAVSSSKAAREQARRRCPSAV